MFGGGDLFGDLPTAKASKALSSPSNENETPDKKDGTNQKMNEAKNVLFLPSNVSLKGNQNRTQGTLTVGKYMKTSSLSNSKKSVSLVGALGNAGTTMAFVPTSLVRKRNRNSVGNKADGASSSAGSKIGGVGIIGKETNSNVMTKKPKMEPISSISNTEKSPIVVPGESHMIKNKQISVDPKSKSNNSDMDINESKANATGTPAPITPNDSSSERESEEMRQLHASVTDANRYDPMVPNDLLAYRERKKNQRRRDQLEKSARETLRLQQIMREKIEEERKKVEATGDYQKIVETRMKTSLSAMGRDNSNSGSGISRLNSNSNMDSNLNISEGMGRGRGRGRGVSNLPAWLIKKQQEENALGDNKDLDKTKNQNQRDAKISQSKTLVLLSNMTAPGNIDDDLSEEVREECEMQCGPVKYVKILDADHSHKEVRVYVKFSNASDAEKASKLFHGRSFAQRIISASLVEDKEMI